MAGVAGVVGVVAANETEAKLAATDRATRVLIDFIVISVLVEFALGICFGALPPITCADQLCCRYRCNQM